MRRNRSMIVSLISFRSTGGGRLGASIAAAVWLALAPAAPAGAQMLIRGTLKMVVPFAPGGPSDVAGRIVAAGLSEVLGRSVIVENPAGAGGTIGSLRVSRSTPDGSEFVLANSGTHVWSQALYKTPPYNTLTDFTPLGLVVEAPRVIIAPKNFPADTLQEFIAYLKAKKGTAKYGHAGARLGIACELYFVQRRNRRRHRRCTISRPRTGNAGFDCRPHRLFVRFAIDIEAADRRRLRQGNRHNWRAALVHACAGADGS